MPLNTLNNGSAAVFFGATPNQDYYYIPAAKTNQTIANDYWGHQFYNYLTTNFPYLVFSLKTFKITDGYIDIPNTTITLYQSSNPYKISYFAVKIREKYLFYFVNNIDVKPDRFRLYVDIDNWGTYVGGLSIKNARFTRSNMQLGQYEQRYNLPAFPQAFNGYIKKYPLSDTLPNGREGLRIYAVVRQTTYQTDKQNIEVIRCYMFNIRDVLALYPETPTDLPPDITVEDIQKAVEAVASIFEISQIFSITPSITKKYTAEVLHVYLSHHFNEDTSVQLSDYRFKGIISGTEETFPAKEVNSQIKRRIEVIANSVTYTPNFPTYPNTPLIRRINIDALGCDLYFGTMENNIKLPNFAGCLTVCYSVQFLNDRLQFLVECDGEQRDITECFEIAIVANSSAITSQQATARALSNMANLAGGVLQVVTGGVSGAVSGVARIASTFNELGAKNENKGSYIGGGAGWLTNKDIIENDTGDSAISIIVTPPTKNNVAVSYLNKYGAECDYMQDLTSETEFFTFINSRPFLSQPPSITPPRVIACECDIIDENNSGVPYSAILSIKDIFAAGVKLKTVEV